MKRVKVDYPGNAPTCGTFEAFTLLKFTVFNQKFTLPFWNNVKVFPKMAMRSIGLKTVKSRLFSHYKFFVMLRLKTHSSGVLHYFRN